jgi:molecular chaperone GrpE
MTKERRIKINIGDTDPEQPEGLGEEEAIEEIMIDAEDESPEEEEAETAPVGEEKATEPEPALSEEDKLKGRVAELEDRLLRTMADFDNYKKRTARQYDEMVNTANEKLLVSLLEVVDSFERALEHAEDKTDFKAFRKGVELIFSQVMDLLARYDVKPIKALGQPFDPGRHEAMMQIASDKYDEGVVAMEMAKGYMRGNRVIRYSKVAVSTGKDKKKEK